MRILEALKTRWILWVWRHTPDCAQMSRLASRRLDQRLPARVRFKMWLHYGICVWCQRYKRQLGFLHRAAPRLDEHPDATHALSAAAKERMAARLKAERER